MLFDSFFSFIKLPELQKKLKDTSEIMNKEKERTDKKTKNWRKKETKEEKIENKKKIDERWAWGMWLTEFMNKNEEQ